MGNTPLILSIAVEENEIPGVVPSSITETASMQYRLAGWVLPLVIGGLGLLVYFRLCVATAAMVSEKSSASAALRHSWVLTRGARSKTYGIGLLIAATVTLVSMCLMYAAGPVAHPAGLAMLWLSDDNVWITGTLVHITPTAVALLLLPLVILTPVCSVTAVLYADLQARMNGETLRITSRPAHGSAAIRRLVPWDPSASAC